MLLLTLHAAAPGCMVLLQSDHMQEKHATHTTQHTTHTTQNKGHIQQHIVHATRNTGHNKERTTQNAEHLNTQRTTHASRKTHKPAPHHSSSKPRNRYIRPQTSSKPRNRYIRPAIPAYGPSSQTHLPDRVVSNRFEPTYPPTYLPTYFLPTSSLLPPPYA